MMWILLDTYHDNNGKIYVPPNIKKRSLEYFTETDPIFKWFREIMSHVKYQKIQVHIYQCKMYLHY